MKNNIPNKDECLQILHDYGTPSHVIAHCMEVARVSVAIGEKLNDIGYHLNIPLLKASAILHDIARVHDYHESVGAEYLRTLGFEEIASLIERHTKYIHFHPVEEIDEIDLLCIGDRTVKENKYVGVDTRMDYIVEKAIRLGRAAHVDHINISRKELKAYINTIEEKIGITIEELMKGNDEQFR